MDVLLLSGTLLFVHSLIDNLLLQPGAAAILHGLLEFVGLHVSCEDMALDSHSTLLALASRNAIHYIVNPDPIRLVLSMVSLSLATMVWMICGKLLLLRSDLISYSVYRFPSAVVSALLTYRIHRRQFNITRFRTSLRCMILSLLLATSSQGTLFDPFRERHDLLLQRASLLQPAIIPTPCITYLVKNLVMYRTNSGRFMSQRQLPTN